MGLLDEAWERGRPYREALGGLLMGDTRPAMGLLNTKSPVDPMDGVNAALAFAPLGLGTLKPVGKAGKIASMMDDTYKGKFEGPNYQIEHKPMSVDGGAARLHELESAFGPDIYGPNALQYFGSGSFSRQEREALNLMRKVRGNPDAEITIYRGVPDGVKSINPGDWVTLSPEMASQYGNVLSIKVPARQVTSWPDSLLEYGWFPD